ncbi:MAG: hypothetical protein AAF557_26300 [Pseudomonadota bacterium]
MAFVMAVEGLFHLRKNGCPETGEGEAITRTPFDHLADLHDLMWDGRRLYDQTVADQGRSYDHDLGTGSGRPSSENLKLILQAANEADGVMTYFAAVMRNAASAPRAAAETKALYQQVQAMRDALKGIVSKVDGKKEIPF